MHCHQPARIQCGQRRRRGGGGDNNHASRSSLTVQDPDAVTTGNLTQSREPSGEPSSADVGRLRAYRSVRYPPLTRHPATVTDASRLAGSRSHRGGQVATTYLHPGADDLGSLQRLVKQEDRSETRVVKDGLRQAITHPGQVPRCELSSHVLYETAAPKRSCDGCGETSTATSRFPALGGAESRRRSRAGGRVGLVPGSGLP
jgi:hypothetical protein